MNTYLFQQGDFVLHSGKSSYFKIKCDALTEQDYKTLAEIVANKFIYGSVIGVPAGGLKLAHYCEEYINPKSDIMLIVDDVLTTGVSLEKLRETYGYGDDNFGGPIIGVVIFARGQCPDWVTPIFQMWKE